MSSQPWRRNLTSVMRSSNSTKLVNEMFTVMVFLLVLLGRLDIAFDGPLKHQACWSGRR